MIESQQLDRPYVDQVHGSVPFTRSPATDLGDLIDELKGLRKGRGLFVTNISERVRPALRKICGITDRDGPTEIRRKVAHRLENLACALPADLRVAAMAAFAITHDAQLPLYQDRVEWTAARINRDPRTARRRIDDAIHQLAQLATAQPPPRGRAATGPSPRWHTTDLRLVVTLDGEHPEAIEHRRIVACRDGLAELDLAPVGLLVGTVRNEPSTVASLLYGGIRLDAGPGRARALRLPEMLRQGEAHEYALRHQVLPGGTTQPRIAYLPDTRCDHFELRVRFGRERQPHRIWVLDNLSPGTVNADAPTRELPANAAGEVHLTFGDLVPGRVYGVRWAW